MGHERIGGLPRSRKWRDVVDMIASSTNAGVSVPEISKRTIENVRSRFHVLERDEGVSAAFTYLVALSVASKNKNPREQLEELGIEMPSDLTALSVTRSLKDWVKTNSRSLEYSEIAQRAAADAIAFWYRRTASSQESFFKGEVDPFGPWRQASDGAGFCELSRVFFAKFTERYMKYFLEREASSVLSSVADRENFTKQIEANVDAVSKHAFETSKITQSFAAGWFNKHSKGGIPNHKQIEGFVSFAFEKLREELSREGSAP